MSHVAALTGGLSILKSVMNIRYVVASRLYSVYPQNYVSPTFNKNDQAMLRETGEDLQLAHVPIKPALVYETSSEFYDHEVTKFTNYIMRKGQRILARKMIERTFEFVKRIQLKRYHEAQPEHRNEIELDPINIFYRAIENVTPLMELKKIKRGGASYQVPVPILENRQRFLAMNWLIQAGKDKHRSIKFPECLAKELINAAYNEGRVVKKKQELHKNCEANRAYAHYRWT